MAFDWDADPIMRISGDYRANGMQRSVVGSAVGGEHAGKWVLEEFNLAEGFDPRTTTAEGFDPRTTTDRFAITYFDDSRAASAARHERGYR